MKATDYLKSWAAIYRKDLTENIMPFWLKYGLDHKYGGIYTCLDREGRLMDTTKSVWFQGRFGLSLLMLTITQKKIQTGQPHQKVAQTSSKPIVQMLMDIYISK